MNRTEHREEKYIFPFVEYAPEEKKANLPLVIQLHGAGERGEGGEDLEKVDVHGFSKYLKEAEYECIVVMPQCPKNTFWAARVESIVRFIEQLIHEYGADKDRVYLTGLSMGGYGTWFTSMARPDLFAAIAPVCGGGMAWNADVLKMPVWAFHGAEDPTVSVTQSDEMVARLKELGRDVTYTRLAGVGHNAWDYAYNKELLDWLLSKKRQ
ncbi:MAG: prolyl oligopeptidase family serine peptidase [Clostridia bacterium]|nr:prolyl oligopeptidase family serine peptidase [Clostridia bacterium]